MRTMIRMAVRNVRPRCGPWQLVTMVSVLVGALLLGEARGSEELLVTLPGAGSRSSSELEPALPVGQVELGDFHFVVGRMYQLGGTSTRPSATVVVRVESPRSVMLLLNSFDTWSLFAGANIGLVALGFDDGTRLETPLVIGTNVREWRQRPTSSDTVDTVSDPAVEEVYRAPAVDAATDVVMDMLPLALPQDVWEKTLTSVTVSNTLAGAGTPGIMWTGVTVRREPVRLVYVEGGELWIAERDGTAARRLTTDSRECANPALSPDGRTIAYVSTDAASHQVIRLLDMRTGTSTPLVDTLDTTPPPRPYFTTDGGRLVFHMRTVTTTGTPRSDVFTIGVDGTDLQQVTRTRGRDEQHPTVAPDGTLVAYVLRGRIYVARADGTGRHALVRPRPELTEADEPAFLPDGSGMLFTGRVCRRGSCTPSDVFAIDLDGANFRQLTTGLGTANQPTATPDGRTIAFATSEGLWTAAADGSGRSLVLAHAAAPSYRAAGALPFGCFKRSQVDVCYRPFRAMRDTPLLTSPDPRAPQVEHTGGRVTVPAGSYIGRQSDRNPSCSNRPGLRPSVNGYIWGYLALEGSAFGRGKSGWIRETDVTQGDDFGSALCGPAREDFDCRAAYRSACDRRDACSTGSNDQPRDASGDRQMTRAEYVHMAADSSPSLWVLPGDRVRRYGLKTASSGHDFACVEVLSAQFVPKGRAGWVRGDALGPLPPVCGNRKREAGEECDDGDRDSCDGCDSVCRREGCGNGRLECREECDDHNRQDGDSCDANCFLPRQRCDVQCCDGSWAPSSPYGTVDAVQCQQFADSWKVCRDHGGWSGLWLNGQGFASVACTGRCGIECCRYSASPTLFRTRGSGECMGNLVCEARGSAKRNVFWVPDGGVGHQIYHSGCPSTP